MLRPLWMLFPCYYSCKFDLKLCACALCYFLMSSIIYKTGIFCGSIILIHVPYCQTGWTLNSHIWVSACPCALFVCICVFCIRNVTFIVSFALTCIHLAFVTLICPMCDVWLMSEQYLQTAILPLHWAIVSPARPSCLGCSVASHPPTATRASPAFRNSRPTNTPLRLSNSVSVCLTGSFHWCCCREFSRSWLVLVVFVKPKISAFRKWYYRQPLGDWK